MEQLRYPTGRWKMPTTYDRATVLDDLKRLGALPEKLLPRLRQLHDRKLLDTPYRPGGWTGQQVIHHLADSHLHAYRRHKVTLLEDHPTLIPYDQQRWADLADVTATPIWASYEMLKGLHLRLALLLSQCTEAQWQRTAYHPGSGLPYRLYGLSSQYAWHGEHHLGHLDLILAKE